MALFPLWETILLSRKKKKNCPQKELKQTTSLLLPASRGCSSIPFEMSDCRDAFKGAQWGTTTNCKKTLYLRTILQLIFHITYFSRQWQDRKWKLEGKKTSGKVNSNLVWNMKIEVTHRRPVLVLSNLDIRCALFQTQKHLCVPDLQTPLWIWSSHCFLLPFALFSHLLTNSKGILSQIGLPNHQFTIFTWLLQM